ncbi:organic solute transporter subunit alpha-like [Amblyraja radiata]|uniref:organic solute transporter subunit alpha-like n=1 Tax=Amblyraja radiata TaxID=386614 RepID=UPI001403385D|nr:organic solute transporter subunit alpha-like [Amblyraja radiata]XP_032889063.1 organic solute transporter subunit alpha-like [Amblyraja radiata]
MAGSPNRSLELLYCGSSPPEAAQILKDLNLPAIILYSVLTLMAVIANLVYLEEVIYLLRKVPSTNRRATIMWISGAAPVIASTSCIGMWVPLASMITDLTTAVYFAIVIHKFQRMMIEEFGGDEAFLERFENTPVKMSTGPCCCCCLCIPFGKISRRLMFILKIGTFQLAFLRPVLMIFTLVLWVNGTFSLDDLTPSGPAIWINTSLGVSTILALWPIGIVFNKVKVELKNQKIIPKFTLYQISFILTQLQAAILNITALSGGIACAPPFSPTARAGYMNQQLLIMEMFIITILSRIYYRRKYNPLEIDEMQDLKKSQMP